MANEINIVGLLRYWVEEAEESIQDQMKTIKDIFQWLRLQLK
jgi:hypothetical protein